MNPRSRFDLRYVVNRCVVMRATFMAAIVGTILVLINHGMCLYHGKFGLMCFCQTVLTFMVPYAVSTVSSVLAMSETGTQARQESSTGQESTS